MPFSKNFFRGSDLVTRLWLGWFGLILLVEVGEVSVDELDQVDLDRLQLRVSLQIK